MGIVLNLKQCVGRGERLVNRSVVELTPRYSAGDIDARVTGNKVIATTGIATVWADSWPPPITKNDNEANLLIVKAFGLLISYGEIKLKKPR